MLAADSTKVLLVGISKYSESALSLRFAASNARELRRALIDPQGCAIPASEIAFLCDEDATAATIAHELTRAAGRCGKEDILIIYFSGHGERDGSRFYLLPHETESSALRETAVPLEVFQSALAGCQARGLLVILDCCKSAGFAENADAFFRTLSGSEFRLLLSASRAGQLSYEIDDVGGTFFTNAILRVLTGSVVVGQNPGLVYFSDLFEFVQRQVAEDLESSGQSVTLQEPVFAGTFTKDPRLFILSRLSLERVEAETPRYSRKFLRRRIRRIIFTFGFGLLLLVCAYYTYLDHSRYIWHETGMVDEDRDEYLSIYAGDPRLNWLGFPHRVFTTDIRASALPPATLDNPVTSRFDLVIEPRLFAKISPEWQTAVSAWSGTNDPWHFLSQLNPFDTPDASGLPEATSALASMASVAQSEQLEDLVSSEATKSSPKALRKIASLNPDRALTMLSEGDDMGSFDPPFTIAVLEGLPPRCDPNMAQFLERTAARADDNSYIHDAWYGALLRTGCLLPSKTFLKELDRRSPFVGLRLDWLAGLANAQPADFNRMLIADINQLIPELANEQPDSDQAYRDSELLWAELRTAILFCPNDIPRGVTALLTSSSKHLRVAAAMAAVAQGGTNDLSTNASYTADPWVLAILAKNGWFSDDQARSAILPLTQVVGKGKPAEALAAADAVIFMLRAIRLRQLKQAKPFVEEVFASFPTPELRIEALRTLKALSLQTTRDVSFDPDAVLMPSGDLLWAQMPGAFMDDSRWWFIRHDRHAYASFINKLADAESSEVAQVLGRVPLPESVLSTLRGYLRSSDKKVNAATILAMRGNEVDLEVLLSSPDFTIRHQAEIYAAYNPHLPTIVEQVAFRRFGARTHFFLRQQLIILNCMEQRMKALPLLGRAVLISILSKENSEASPGVMIVAQDAIDELEGGTQFVGQNIDEYLLR